ncbi:MAG: MBOAT family O-acyltransferase [Candidatus Obscuribacter sp.]|nr:MBOAT family O-acyltransferase [Candidatus Obscuribacter sp.]
MIFCTYWFLISVALFLPLYWCLGLCKTLSPSLMVKLRLWALLIFCAVFHSHFAGAAGVAPIAVLALVTYVTALTASKFKKGGSWLCISTIVIVTAALITYKYSRFLLMDVLASVNKPLAEHFAASVFAALPATPPLAISFFAFEFIHYLYEVRRGREPIKKPQDFLAFAIFFPSLVAGPIKRYQDFIPSLYQGLSAVNSRDVAAGMVRLAAGFFKKLMIADNLNQYIMEKEAFYFAVDLPERWLFLLALAGRIYYDFSGYTDIAIGLAMMMGIKLPPNFNGPYGASNIRDFWQRWHMSLSFWIRDYIYIPLGGSQHGLPRRILSGILAFALCGLWHGASWNFLFWGLYHGLGLAINTVYRKLPWLSPLWKLYDKYPLTARLTTFLFVVFGWLPFFYPLDKAWSMFLMLFQFKGISSD